MLERIVAITESLLEEITEANTTLSAEIEWLRAENSCLSEEFQSLKEDEAH